MRGAPKSRRAWQAMLGFDDEARLPGDSESEAIVHLNAGWRMAVPSGANDATRWWVTAFVTDRAIVDYARASDRVLLRGDVEDFVLGVSNLSVIEDLLQKGVSVRRLPRLHAKVYASVESDHGVMWLGSANATTQGRAEHSGQNIEAMVGPLVVGPEHVRVLEILWDRADAVDVEAIRKKMRQLVDEKVRSAAMALSNGVIMVRLSVPRPSAHLVIRPDWFDYKRRSTIRTESRHTIPYVPKAHPARQDVAEFAHELTSRLRREGLLRMLGGTLGHSTYLVDVDDVPYLDSILERADRLVYSVLGRALADARVELESSLIERLEDVLGRLMTRPGYEPEEVRRASMLSHALSEARRDFLDYVDRFTFGVRYFLSIPFESNDAEFLEALNKRQARLFTRRRESPETIVRAVLEAAGIGAA